MKTKEPGTLRNVNILFLVVIILVLIFGSMMQSTAPLWGLVGTQIFLILLPTLIYLRVSKLPLRETIRWRWPGGRLAILSILLGISVIPFALWLGNLFSHLLGYTPGIHPGFFPSTSGQAVLMFAGIAILAPLCEEILFRGVIQPPYERFGPWKAVLFVGFLFLVFHLSLLRLFALIPVALLLGYLVWASNSLIPAVLAHAAYNAPIAILNNLSSLRPDIPWETYISLPLAIAGLLGLVVGLVLFHRYATTSRPLDAHQPSFSPHNSWPVLIILVIFVFTASLEFVFSRFPDLLVARPLQLTVPPLEQPKTWHYELRDPLDTTVGELQCQMTPGEVIYSLECQKEVERFTVELDQSLFHMESTTSHWNV
ncbi:MAG: CPBP family intramembrane metalloprotease, partial [Anaerolineales bacterium]|nr:CPBP family intramembrane metalloprotease [Anaerolineales bacterium]